MNGKGGTGPLMAISQFLSCLARAVTVLYLFDGFGIDQVRYRGAFFSPSGVYFFTADFFFEILNILWTLNAKGRGPWSVAHGLLSISRSLRVFAANCVGQRHALHVHP